MEDGPSQGGEGDMGEVLRERRERFPCPKAGMDVARLNAGPCEGRASPAPPFHALRRAEPRPEGQAMPVRPWGRIAVDKGRRWGMHAPMGPCAARVATEMGRGVEEASVGPWVGDGEVAKATTGPQVAARSWGGRGERNLRLF